jgi:beta-lactam-binding protein with PASTA domain
MSAGSAHNTIAAANLIPTGLSGQKATDTVLFTSPAPGSSVAEGTPVLIIAASELAIIINGQKFDLKL